MLITGRKNCEYLILQQLFEPSTTNIIETSSVHQPTKCLRFSTGSTSEHFYYKNKRMLSGTVKRIQQFFQPVTTNIQ